MHISNLAPALAATRTLGVKTQPPAMINNTGDTKSGSNASKTVDMHNISLNEINTLIKSGVDGLLDILPATPSPVYGELADDAADVKTDFIGNLEGQIAFQKSQGEDTAFLEKVLNRINHLNGMKWPTTIDETV